MKKPILVLTFWLSCGYFNSAMWTADMYLEFPDVETRGTAARSSLLWFVLGPAGTLPAFALCEHAPMWDWPKYLLDYSRPKQPERKP